MFTILRKNSILITPRHYLWYFFGVPTHPVVVCSWGSCLCVPAYLHRILGPCFYFSIFTSVGLTFAAYVSDFQFLFLAFQALFAYSRVFAVPFRLLFLCWRDALLQVPFFEKEHRRYSQVRSLNFQTLPGLLLFVLQFLWNLRIPSPRKRIELINNPWISLYPAPINHRRFMAHLLSREPNVAR